MSNIEQPIATNTQNGSISNISAVGRYSLESPVQAVFNNKIYLAWAGQNTKKLKVIFSEDNGLTWGDFTETGQLSDKSPALCVFQGKLYLSYSEKGSKNLCVISSKDGITWSDPVDTTRNTGTGPSMCAYNGKLYLSWSGKNSHNVKVISSSDGISWSPFVDTERNTDQAPSICAFNNKLFITWSGINSKKIKVISSSDNGNTWTSFVETGQHTKASPSIIMTHDKLFIAFKSKDNKDLMHISSSDGTSWSNATVVGTSTDGPAIAVKKGILCWAFINSNGSNEIMYGNTGGISRGTNQQIPLYRDQSGPKVHFKMYYNYQMNNPIEIHPDTGSFHFNVQAKDLRIGVNAQLSGCQQGTSCNWSSVPFNSNFTGSSIPINASDLPDANGLCGWDCTSSGTNGSHSRLCRISTLPAFSLEMANNQYPNIPCSLIGYGFNKQSGGSPRNWSQLGMGYPGDHEKAFFNQVDYTTYNIAVNDHYNNANGQSVGYWGLDLNVTGKQVLLDNIPFYVQHDTPDVAAGTRQLKLGISVDGISSPNNLIPVNFDSGTPDAYRIRKDHHLMHQICAYFKALATTKGELGAIATIDTWAATPNSFLELPNAIFLDSSGNYIDLPFQFEALPTSPLFSRGYYVKHTHNGKTTTFFKNSNKNTFGLPFFVDREFVFTDKPADGISYKASIYKF